MSAACVFNAAPVPKTFLPGLINRAIRQLAFVGVNNSNTHSAAFFELTMTLEPVTAIDALAVLSGVLTRDVFVARLVTQSVVDTESAEALWRVAADKQDIATFAYNTRRQFINANIIPVTFAGVHDSSALLARIKGYAAKCAFQVHGDGFVAMTLKVLLPTGSTEFLPRNTSPYKTAADNFGDKTNRRVRPLLTTPITEVLETATWGPTDLRGLFAAVATLREMHGGAPQVYIDSEIASAPPAEPVIAVCRKDILDGGVGVLQNNTFTKTPTVLDTLHVWCDRYQQWRQ